MNTQTVLISLSIEELKTLIADSLSTGLQTYHSTEPEKQEEPLLKIEDICSLFNVSKVTIHDWKRKGILPFYRISRKIYFKKNEVIDALTKAGKRGLK